MAVVKFSSRIVIEALRRPLAVALFGAAWLAASAAGTASADVADAAPAGKAAAAGATARTDSGEAAAFAADRAALQERLQPLQQFAASFTQTVYGVRGEVLESASGHVRLDRPRFKWVVDDPYPQVLLVDDDRLKLYDPDLEQLTIRPLDEALQDTPVALLTRDAVALTDSFRVMRLSDPDGDSFVIEPTAEDTLYREILLHFKGPELIGLDILDHLGQRTEVRFAADPDAVVDDADFALEVPPDTDVIGG